MQVCVLFDQKYNANGNDNLVKNLDIRVILGSKPNKFHWLFNFEHQKMCIIIIFAFGDSYRPLCPLNPKIFGRFFFLSTGDWLFYGLSLNDKSS